MPKTIYTPREELVCGKLDVLEDMSRKLHSVEMLYTLADVRHDCERMEMKLVSRKDEVAKLRAALQDISDYGGQKNMHPADKARVMWQTAYIALHGDNDTDGDE